MLLASGVTEVRPVLGTIDPASIAGRAGLMADDELVQIDQRPVASQRDVMLGLLDAVSDQSPITLQVRGSDGALRTLVTAAFSHRRKTLRNGLKGLLSAADIAACGIDPGLRPETLSGMQFGLLATRYHKASTAA